MPILLCRKKPTPPWNPFSSGRKDAMSVSEGWKGGDAKQPTVELAKEENGRTDKSSSKRLTSWKL